MPCRHLISGFVRLLLVLLLTATAASAAGPVAPAHPPAAAASLHLVQGLEAGKICQVIRSCNFRRSAKVRGCLSSYSCRQCKFVKRCSDGRCEWQSVCSWGGG